MEEINALKAELKTPRTELESKHKSCVDLETALRHSEALAETAQQSV